MVTFDESEVSSCRLLQDFKSEGTVAMGAQKTQSRQQRTSHQPGGVNVELLYFGDFKRFNTELV